MDRLSKWATTGSLAWLVMAVGLILGTHGGGTKAAAAPEAPATGECPETPVATAPATVTPVADTRS